MTENIKMNIVKSLGIVAKNDKGYTKELNIISWNDGAPKFDLRQWTPDDHRALKGITLSDHEMILLYKILQHYYKNIETPEVENG